MKCISFNPRFANEAGNDLLPGKIHTIRRNYEYWKRFEGQEVALFTWEGKPYRSKQKVFCVKRIVSVQEINFYINHHLWTSCSFHLADGRKLNYITLAKNDGFDDPLDLIRWFENYKPGKMAILHFTDFWY